MTRNIPDEFIEYVEPFDDYYGVAGGPAPAEGDEHGPLMDAADASSSPSHPLTTETS